MSQQTTEVGMSQKVTLSVHKNSPHIWAGGLEGKALAFWLIGRANAILTLHDHHEGLAESRESYIDFKAFENLKTAYAGLGLSLTDSDPIPSLSMEAIQFDISLAQTLRTPATPSESPADPVPPVGYSLLPDLDGELTISRQMKADLSEQESSPFGRKLID
jgi:hypothetical protein|nr:hypothetical protein [Enterobacter ludwigii]